MGAPIAECLIASGYQVSVYDPNPLALKPLVDLGARAATSARDAASGVSTVFACLPSPTVSREVALGEAGIGRNLPDLKIYIEASTIGTSAIKEIAQGLKQQGISLLDAPVSGGPRGARAV
jgi:3-hydroxyisobutyrate dehydrogenase-like beta-hydroxyacid dehydrogenase